MRVGVEKAVREDHLEHHLGAGAGDAGPIDPGCVQRREIIDLDSGDALQRQHPPGRCTLTTTGVPSSRVAACTWPMEADASGTSSKSLNMVSMGRPNSDSMMERTRSVFSGGAASCSFASSSW